MNTTQHLVIIPLLIALSLVNRSPVVAQDATHELKPITPTDIVNLRWSRHISLSPDGTRIAILIDEPAFANDPLSKRSTTLWLASTDGKQQLTHVAIGHRDVSSPKWSRDSSRLCFLAKDEEQHQQIWMLKDKSSSPVMLTHQSHGIERFDWSPNGRALTFVSPVVEESQKKTGDEVIVDGNLRFSRLWELDLKTSTLKRIFAGDEHVIEFAWSRGGDRLALVVSKTPHEDERFDRQQLILVDPDRGTSLRTLSEHVARYGLPIQWSPDGTTIVFPDSTQQKCYGSFQLGFVSVESSETVYPLEEIQSRFSVYRKVRWSEDSSQVLLQVADKTRTRLLASNLNGDFEARSDGIDNFWSFEVSRDGKTLAFNAEGPGHPPEVVIERDGKRTKLTDFGIATSKFTLGNVEEIQWNSSFDGLKIAGVLVTPPGYQQGTPVSTIVELHGGPHAFMWSGWLGYPSNSAQLLASRGYAVFMPNYRGSMGQGIPFAEANFRDHGGADVEDILSGVNYLVQQGIADPDRLGIGGASTGGFLTAHITTRTSRFRCAIIEAGLVDLTTEILGTDTSRAFQFQSGDPILQRESLQRLSPLTYVNRCRTPTLILHGENDIRVPVQQGRFWHRALRLQDIPCEMVIYPREGHGIAERAHQINRLERISSWFDKHLK